MRCRLPHDVMGLFINKYFHHVIIMLSLGFTAATIYYNKALSKQYNTSSYTYKDETCMNFPGTYAILLADLTLVVQTAAFMILLFGVMHVKKKNFSKHFKAADIAVLSGILAFLWMGSSLLNNYRALISSFTSPITTLAIFHAAIGSLALIGGMAFVSNRFIKKTMVPMRIIFLFWALALFLGITLYIMFYVF